MLIWPDLKNLIFRVMSRPAMTPEQRTEFDNFIKELEKKKAPNFKLFDETKNELQINAGSLLWVYILTLLLFAGSMVLLYLNFKYAFFAKQGFWGIYLHMNIYLASGLIPFLVFKTMFFSVFPAVRSHFEFQRVSERDLFRLTDAVVKYMDIKIPYRINYFPESGNSTSNLITGYLKKPHCSFFNLGLHHFFHPDTSLKIFVGSLIFIAGRMRFYERWRTLKLIERCLIFFENIRLLDEKVRNYPKGYYPLIIIFFLPTVMWLIFQMIVNYFINGLEGRVAVCDSIIREETDRIEYHFYGKDFFVKNLKCFYKKEYINDYCKYEVHLWNSLTRNYISDYFNLLYKSTESLRADAKENADLKFKYYKDTFNLDTLEAFSGNGPAITIDCSVPLYDILNKTKKYDKKMTKLYSDFYNNLSKINKSTSCLPLLIKINKQVISEKAFEQVFGTFFSPWVHIKKGLYLESTINKKSEKLRDMLKKYRNKIIVLTNDFIEQLQTAHEIEEKIQSARIGRQFWYEGRLMNLPVSWFTTDLNEQYRTVSTLEKKLSKRYRIGISRIINGIKYLKQNDKKTFRRAHRIFKGLKHLYLHIEEVSKLYIVFLKINKEFDAMTDPDFSENIHTLLKTDLELFKQSLHLISEKVLSKKLVKTNLTSNFPTPFQIKDAEDIDVLASAHLFFSIYNNYLRYYFYELSLITISIEEELIKNEKFEKKVFQEGNSISQAFTEQ